MKPTIIIGGASEVYKRNEADFYATPKDCTEALIRALPTMFSPGKKLWEPACGDGAISKVLEGKGLQVRSTDLHSRGFGTSGVNFLDCEAIQCDAIITNPPFKIAVDFIKRADRLNVPFAMLLKATYWHAASRSDLFEQTKPSHVLPLAWRPAMSPERGKSATMDFCWTVWDRSGQQCEYKVLRRALHGKA